MALLRSDASELAVIDVQERLAGVMPAKVINRLVRNARMLLEGARLIGVPVVATEQYPQGLGPTLPEVAKALPPGTAPVTKTCFSACGADAFRQRLSAREQRPQVVLLGMEVHVCVLQTAFDLLDDGREVHVVEDAVCSRKLENYQNALTRLRDAGVSVVSTESVLFEWLRDASHEQFKAISALLR